MKGVGCWVGEVGGGGGCGAAGGGANTDNNRHASSRRKEALAYNDGDKGEMDENERKTEDKTRIKSPY